MKTIIVIEHANNRIEVNLQSDQPLPKTAEEDAGDITQEIGIIAMAYIKREMEGVLGKAVKMDAPWRKHYEPLH
ncbi:hypothetical protein [Kingella oralis]|jgi:hypothetical protein|uniref:hypothetical protein n=1 Tax=Kingella oralis TaxID=505 RepID=UPI00204DD145|nr:MAG TPA: hypothetical protein [Caudoviricetes sp.]